MKMGRETRPIESQISREPSKNLQKQRKIPIEPESESESESKPEPETESSCLKLKSAKRSKEFSELVSSER
jgi:hypothetical protein